MDAAAENSRSATVRSILVADSNQARAQRLVQDCINLGMRASTVEHGAAALEVSLAEPVDLIVGEINLPLVSASKLADILRANPRTHGVRFLFLGREAGNGIPIEVGDVVLPVDAKREEVMRVIVEQMTKCDRIDALEIASGSGGTVEGDLSNLPLADLLQVAHLARRSGRVDVEREGDGETLALLDESAPNRGELGFVLLRDGEVIQAENGTAVGEKALFRMLAWREGRFSFETGSAPGQLPKQRLAPVRALLAEGLRQIAEGDRLALQLPPLSATVNLIVKNSELPNIVHPLTQEVLLLLEHYDLVREIVDRCSFPDYQVLRTLHTLAQREIVRVGQAKVRGLSSSSAEGGLFDEAQLRRLRDYLESATPRGERIVSGKILVVAREAEKLSSLVYLLRSLPAFELAPELEGGVEPRLGLGPLGTLRLEGEIELELLQLPCSDAYRPLWPMAADRALGTLFLHGPEVSEAALHEGDIFEVLEAGTRTDVLHVVLYARKDRVSPDDLQQNLALLGDASLCMIPLDSGSEPISLLYNMFARVVP
jgi:CheY-like chemotaxis protein